MARAAARDWYDQGHLWQLAADERTTPAGPPTADDAAAVDKLLTADLPHATAEAGAPPEWPAAFEQAGRRLFHLDRAGVPYRGLHAILAQHVLFAWNRLGLAEPVQAALAHAAAAAVFHTETVRPERENSPPADEARAEAGAVNTHTTTDPAHLRQQLVDHIKGRGTFRTTAVERAFSIVPRELFLPETSVEDAYAPKVQITKRADDGSALSSASDPNGNRPSPPA
jgi:protein-L-isoaspartate(D-aspartate) O-methyltransferase